jgi:hypothetical protein
MSREHSAQPQDAAVASPPAAFDQLRTLLERQLDLVRQGHLAEAGALCEKAGPLVGAIASAELVAGSVGEDRRRSLLLLYRRICLTLAAQRDEVADSLRTIHRGRRLLKTYAKRAP